MASLDRLTEGPGEGVADDDERGGCLAFDDFEDAGRVEAFDDSGEDDRVSGKQAGERRPLTGAVHERRQWHDPRPSALGRHSDDRLDVGPFVAGPSVASTERRHVHVGLAPQHPLRHAGGPTGVEDVEVVRCRVDPGVGVAGCEGVVEPDSAGQQGVVRRIGYLDQRPWSGDPLEHLGERRSECRVVDEAAGSAVVQQVGEFLGHIPVVDVEGHHPCFEAAEVGDQELGTVVEVEPERVLSDLVVGEFVAFPVHLEPLVDQVATEPAGPVLHVGVGEAQVSVDEVVPVGYRPGDGPCEQGEVVVGHGGLQGGFQDAISRPSHAATRPSTSVAAT